MSLAVDEYGLGASAAPRLAKGASQPLTPFQAAAFALAFGGGGLALALDAYRTGFVLHGVAWCLFATASAIRMVCAGAAGDRPSVPPVEYDDTRLPRYTLLLALRNEAPVARQLVQALERIDYPRRRLEALLILEPEDTATAEALAAAQPPAWIRIVTAPPSPLKTKPRALNHGLALARGRNVVVYDAEDAPHPLQLREAAARFACSGPALACLQAPLRIRAERGFLARQFAAEYAGLFQVLLPAHARHGAPFPLGGTSNHFRIEALREAGGWDPYNVTEDADLGFRLARAGYAIDVLTLPTLETAAGRLRDWLPQRARWIKGYMQTLAVHLRRPAPGLNRRLGVKGLGALAATLGLGVLAAAAHAAMLALILAELALSFLAWAPPRLPLQDMALLGFGWTAATLICRTGARRADQSYGLKDAAFAPLYWSLSSLAFAHAAFQFVFRPFHWDKTAHLPVASRGPRRLDAAARLGESGRHAGRRPAFSPDPDRAPDPVGVGDHAHPRLARLRLGRQRRRQEA